ncbi:Unknown protein [Striga hermonthica]|uniref:Uncharacterized protein n=1 Tax=Striga hermonthica TaxID=68872 RepID=A0A9N7R324_STRHE|nr:Unknown protein [Striga hermonthica]
MLHLFFAVAFSAVPLTLYIPPVRSFNLFVETMEAIDLRGLGAVLAGDSESQAAIGVIGKRHVGPPILGEAQYSSRDVHGTSFFHS